MISISLPLLKGEAGLEKARELMVASRHSGVVLEHPGGEFRLYTAAEVVLSLASGKSQLREARGLKLELPDVARIANETPGPYMDYATLALAMGGDAGVVAAGFYGTSEQAALFVKNMDLLAALEPAPVDCYCPKCRRPGARGKTCDKDGNKITCWPE